MNKMVITGADQVRKQAETRLRLRDEWREKLLSYKFTHFITLASNHQDISYGKMRDILKRWDARVNRELNGAKWAKRPDERLLWFAFPEKMDVNSHWHLIAQVDPVIETATRKARTARLETIAEEYWLRLLPRGSFDCQDVESPQVIEYVTKMSADQIHFERFVVYREFMNI